MTTQDSSRRSPSYFRLIQRAVHPAYTRLMLRRAAAAIWNEPPPRRPAAILWWDVAIPAVAIPLGVWEALAADAAPWRPVAVVLAVLLPWPMVIRRRRPLVAFIAGFTPSLLVDVVAIAAEVPWKAGASGIFVLLLAYSLFRWGAGRDAVIGVLLLAVVVAISTLKGEIHTAPEAIAAVVVLLFGPTLGVALRFRASAHRQALDHARLRERAQLARELHDTVAHHVSAIALQAQAGRAVAATRPAAALATLAVIEQAASRTLSELRTIVGALRTDRDAERAPQRGIQDLDALGIAAGPNVAVHVCLRGDLEDLAPSIEAAIYRLVQESVTNAARHAVGASRVDVEVAGGAEEIRVVVADNGAPVSRPAEGPGFGLVGMQERAALLGGTFTAGPRAERGWQVEAVLPRRGFGP